MTEISQTDGHIKINLSICPLEVNEMQLIIRFNRFVVKATYVSLTWENVTLVSSRGKTLNSSNVGVSLREYSPLFDLFKLTPRFLAFF
jgi:hypothetical protein